MAILAAALLSTALMACNLSDDHENGPMSGLDAGGEDVGGDDVGGEDADVTTQCVRENDRDFCERVPDECGIVTAKDNCGDLREVNCSNFVDYGCGEFEECLEADEVSGAEHNACECLSLSDGEVEELICGGEIADCGEVAAGDVCAGWASVGDVDCGSCEGGEECGEVFDNVCGCPCDIDGQCYASGDPAPNQECSICDPAQSEDDFSPAPDETLCDDDDPCTWSDCQGGECISHALCGGTDDECGCATCVDCTEDDGWYEVGAEYDCCDGAAVCTCQDEEYREFGCDGVECDYEVTDERTDKWGCDPCEAGGGVDAICSGGECVEDCGSETFCDGYGVCADLDDDDDHCGGCGSECASNETCDGGTCECVPDCSGKECGSDGCGGSCGSCGSNETCDGGSCECVPNCSGKECGSDGCGGSCGSCGSGETCDGGSCECVPNCSGKECGSDGCGGSCGSCGFGETCDGGSCECVPNCSGKECGSDGCGGSCGSCPSDGWQDVGGTYQCCGTGIDRCTSCQDREYVEWSCSGGTCESESTDFETEKSDCNPCPDDCVCENGTCPGNLCLQ